jgi:hypothetical protein
MQHRNPRLLHLRKLPVAGSNVCPLHLTLLWAIEDLAFAKR